MSSSDPRVERITAKAPQSPFSPQRMWRLSNKLSTSPMRVQVVATLKLNHFTSQGEKASTHSYYGIKCIINCAALKANFRHSAAFEETHSHLPIFPYCLTTIEQINQRFGWCRTTIFPGPPSAFGAMTAFDIKEPLLAAYDEKSQDSGNGADYGDNSPA